MPNPMISVIVPVYNVETVLPYCLDRIINQTYKELEIIIVNDGSTDNSGLICEKFQKMDARIELVNQTNKGLSEARNAGIEKAKGEYISFIDSDDIIALNFYEYLIKLIIENDADIAECNYVKVAEDEVLKQKIDFNKFKNDSYIVLDKMGAFYQLNNTDVNIVVKTVVVWNKLYKRRLFEDIRFPIGKRYEDDFTTYKVMNKIHKLVSTERILYGYVQRKSSIMNQSFNEKRLDAIEAFDNYMQFFKKIADVNLYEKFLLRYLRIIITILEELNDSSYIGKDKIKEELANKFKDVYKELENIQKDLKHMNDSENITMKERYMKQFDKLI